MLETFILIALVAAAVVYLIQRYVRIFQGKRGCCDSCGHDQRLPGTGSGCSCGSGGGCGPDCQCSSEGGKDE